MCERRFSVKPASQRSFVSGMELADDLLRKLMPSGADFEPGALAGTGNLRDGLGRSLQLSTPKPKRNAIHENLLTDSTYLSNVRISS